jgi:hypothetical protein
MSRPFPAVCYRFHKILETPHSFLCTFEPSSIQDVGPPFHPDYARLLRNRLAWSLPSRPPPPPAPISLAQPFSDPRYFHPHPSSAGAGYAASPVLRFPISPQPITKLQDRIAASVAQLRTENPTTPIPIDLLTTSSSGLDLDITPAAAQFQTNTKSAYVVTRNVSVGVFWECSLPRVLNPS